MTRKKIVAVATAVVVVAGMVVVYLTQVRQPLTSVFAEAKVYTYTAPDSRDLIQNGYTQARQGLATDIQLLSDADFDFADPTDYADAQVYFTLKNTTLFPITNIEFFVTDLGGVEGRFLYKQDAPLPVDVRPGETTTARLDLAMYVNGLSDVDIADLVKRVRVELQFSQALLGGRHLPIEVPPDLAFAQHING